MVNVVDAVIADYAADEPVIEETPAHEAEETKVEEPATEDNPAEPEEAAEEKPEKDREPFPKKAKNTITRLKQSNARKNAEIKQLQQKLAEFERIKAEAAPKEDDFSTYAEYLDAKNEHRMNVKLAETQVNDVQNRVQAYEAEEELERIAEINEIGANFEREHPAASKVIADNLQTISQLPEHIRKAIRAADNPPLALYNLINEGKLQYPAQLPLERAAIEIGKADAKPIPPKPQTKAPTPMQPATGRANAGFNWQAMSADDLLKTIRKG